MSCNLTRKCIKFMFYVHLPIILNYITEVITTMAPEDTTETTRYTTTPKASNETIIGESVFL